MNGILNKFRKRNIQTNICEFVLVIFVVAVSACLIFGLIINYLTLNRAVKKFFTESRLPSLFVETDKLTSEDELFLSENFEFSKRYSFESDFTVNEKTFSSRFLVSNGKVSVPYVIEGSKGNGCFVDAKFAKKYRLGVNYSKIGINYTLNGETKKIEFTVIGTIAMAEDFVSGDECLIFIDENIFKNTIKAYFAEANEEQIKIDYNQALIKSSVGENEKQIISAHFNLPERSVFKMYETSELSSFKQAQKEVKIAKQMTYSFSLLFVIVSILVIVSAIGQLIFKEKYNIGLLKSLGFSNKDLIFNYCGYGVFVCLVGAVIGLAVSPLIVPNITFETYDKMFNLPRDEVSLTCPVWFIALAIFAAIVVGFLSALFVCLKFTHKTPKECMSAKPKSKLKSRAKSGGKSAKISSIISAPIRNMKINLSRTIMSVVGIFGASVLCIIGFGTKTAFAKTETLKDAMTLEMFSNVFKGFSVVLIGLVMVILLVQIFKEREREMALLRVHGEEYLKIWLSVLFEMTFICLIGYVAASVLSVPIYAGVKAMFGIGGGLNLGILSYLKTFLIVFLTDLIVASASLYKIYKLDLAGATKFSE